jgi:hypothetical protein
MMIFWFLINHYYYNKIQFGMMLHILKCLDIMRIVNVFPLIIDWVNNLLMSYMNYVHIEIIKIIKSLIIIL